MADILQDDIEVQYKGDNFLFTIPGIVDETRMAMRAREMRRQANPNGDGSADGLDDGTLTLVAGAAAFEILLKKSSAEWPYSTGKDGKPVVDWNRFPKERVVDVMMVYMEFNKKLARFRGIGDNNIESDSPEAVAGEQDSGGQSV